MIYAYLSYAQNTMHYTCNINVMYVKLTKTRAKALVHTRTQLYMCTHDIAALNHAIASILNTMLWFVAILVLPLQWKFYSFSSFRVHAEPYAHNCAALVQYFLCIEISNIIRSWFRSDWTRHKSSWTLSLCKFGYDHTRTHAKRTQSSGWHQLIICTKCIIRFRNLFKQNTISVCKKGENKIII